MEPAAAEGRASETCVRMLEQLEHNDRLTIGQARLTSRRRSPHQHRLPFLSTPASHPAVPPKPS
eukprot:scaffold33002_cov32-Tisochrysis_lutea.AAC.1